MAEYIMKSSPILEADGTPLEVVGELIRCRNCANYDDNRCYCNVWKAKNQPNDGFCHFGERKPND